MSFLGTVMMMLLLVMVDANPVHCVGTKFIDQHYLDSWSDNVCYIASIDANQPIFINMVAEPNAIDLEPMTVYGSKIVQRSFHPELGQFKSTRAINTTIVTTQSYYQLYYHVVCNNGDGCPVTFSIVAPTADDGAAARALFTNIVQVILIVGAVVMGAFAIFSVGVYCVKWYYHCRHRHTVEQLERMTMELSSIAH